MARNIPPRRNRKDAFCFSPYLYRARNEVERFFNKLKQCRRVATRYDKLAANYLAFIQLASIRLWLRVNEYTPGFGPLSTRCGIWQFSIRARALWLVNVNALTHWQADHAILFTVRSLDPQLGATSMGQSTCRRGDLVSQRGEGPNSPGPGGFGTGFPRLTLVDGVYSRERGAQSP